MLPSFYNLNSQSAYLAGAAGSCVAVGSRRASRHRLGCSELGAPVLNDDPIILQVPAVIHLLSCALEPLGGPCTRGRAPAVSQSSERASAVTFRAHWARFAGGTFAGAPRRHGSNHQRVMYRPRSCLGPTGAGTCAASGTCVGFRLKTRILTRIHSFCSHSCRKATRLVSPCVTCNTPAV